jgi:hypothetical protein
MRDNIRKVADWMGHGDGGGSLMKTCNHLCEAHRLKVARLVRI